jgi:hypothetical protein
MKMCYVPRTFARSSVTIIDQANRIIAAYEQQGYKLTLRQLYYQFVSRDLIPNKQSEYKRLGSIINDARLAGLIDWNAIEDRTRNLKSNNHWNTPASIVRACAEQFLIDKWKTQPLRIEVWIEKDALAGVFDRICSQLDVAYFSCRGYTSQSEMWGAAQRHISFQRNGQKVVVLHFGDHDPSGIDMSRDIQDRLNLFGACTDVRRMALTMAQVREYDPPPNPAKDTDARFAGYSEEFGDESWELDALEPAVLSALVSDTVAELRDADAWTEKSIEEANARAVLTNISENWEDVVQLVSGDDDDEKEQLTDDDE